MTDERRRAVVHEASHAAAAFVLGDEAKIRELWVRPPWFLDRAGDLLGFLNCDQQPDAHRVVTALAGDAGDAFSHGLTFHKTWPTSTATGDMRVARVLLGAMGFPNGLEEAKRFTWWLVATGPFQGLLRVLSARLEGQRKLSGAQVRAILDSKWKEVTGKMAMIPQGASPELEMQLRRKTLAMLGVRTDQSRRQHAKRQMARLPHAVVRGTIDRLADGSEIRMY